MIPLIDISDKSTVSNTTYSSTPTYKVIAPDDRYIILEDLSFGADSNFLSNGKLQIKINGTVSTSQNSASGEIGLINNLDIPFREKSFIFIEPQSTLEVNARVTTGSGVLQIATVGSIVSRDEFAKLRRLYLGE